MRTLSNRIDNMELKLKQEIDGIKRSILYDLHKCVEDIKNTLAISLDGSLGIQLTDCIANLALTLPLSTTEQLNQLNEQLSDPDKEKTFVSFTICNNLYT